jgi:hypothetical protein
MLDEKSITLRLAEIGYRRLKNLAYMLLGVRLRPRKRDLKAWSYGGGAVMRRAGPAAARC